VHESTKRQTVVPAAAEVFYLYSFVVAESLLAPFDEGVALANAVLFDQIGERVRRVARHQMTVYRRGRQRLRH